jgi:hypothetical protein
MVGTGYLVNMFRFTVNENPCMVDGALAKNFCCITFVISCFINNSNLVIREN